MKKLTISALTLFILLLLSHGALPAEKPKALEPESKAIISLDPIHEEFPGPELGDKKISFVKDAAALLTLSGFLIISVNKINRVSAFFAFLTAIFFQSNYVIKPL